MFRRTCVLVLALGGLFVPVATAQAPPTETPPGAPECPTGVAGYAPQTGGVFFSWTLNSATDVKVYRDDGDGTFEFQQRLEFPATRHIDHDTEPGQTYRYQVTAIDENGTESAPCETLEVTTVPFFPSWFAVLGAVAIASTGYLWLRRR